MKISVAIILLGMVVGGAIGLAVGLPLSKTAVAGRQAAPSASSHYTSDDTAPRYIFLAADPLGQVSGSADPNNLPEIWMQVRWRSSQTLRWYITVNETGDPNFEQQIKDAFAQWEVRVPRLDWSDVQEPSSATADIWFNLQNMCTAQNATGTYGIAAQPGSADTWRRANYVTLAAICIRADLSSSQRRETLLHEMGHAYGLHERYLLDYSGPHWLKPSFAGCNTRETTVMDATGCDSLTAPTLLDAQRVVAFWRDGWPNYPTLGADIAKTGPDFPQVSVPSTGVVRGLWGDWSWGQTSFHVAVQYQSGVNWYDLSSRWRDDDVGAHGLMTGYPVYLDLTPTPTPPPAPTPTATPEKKVDMRLFQEDFDVRALGGPNNSSYRVCINSDDYGYGGGLTYCTNSVFVVW